jgi:hypothetical protein
MAVNKGIEYQFVAARPMFYPVKRPKTHMAIIAKVEGKDWGRHRKRNKSYVKTLLANPL